MKVSSNFLFSFRERKSAAVSFLTFRQGNEIRTRAAVLKLSRNRRHARYAYECLIFQKSGWYRGLSFVPLWGGAIFILYFIGNSFKMIWIK